MAVPEIRLTDPFNHDSAPSPAQSPMKDSGYAGIGVDLAAAVRPNTPAAKNGNSASRQSQVVGDKSKLTRDTARTESPSRWTSPTRLVRSRSSNNSASTYATPKEDATTPVLDAPTGIDPLSQHILQRTNTPLNLPSAPPRPKTPDTTSAHRDDKKVPEQSAAPAVQEPMQRSDTANTVQRDLRKGVKAVSFLSRLMGAKKREADEEAIDDDDESTSETRPEGNHAQVFAQPVDNMGFDPRHPGPPAYIKVRSKHKKERDFNRLFLAQELHCGKKPPMIRRDSSNKLRRKSSATPTEGNTVWAMEFSRDGKYLAAAGADTVVRVWAVLGSSEDRQKHEQQETAENEANGTNLQAGHLSAPVFQSKPIREYHAHTSTVLDLSWSKNNFLLSSSMDKTVRLWHVSRPECLCTFKHTDFVPSISFHPKDDRFFLAGSLDARLRLWSIPEKQVAYATQTPDMVTAVSFTPDGKTAIAGCLGGQCLFYETDGLRYQTQISVRSSRGQNAKAHKITGIQAQHGVGGSVKILVTSNDSRIRLYNFRDKSLEVKLKGNENNCSQIRAVFSDDGKFVICGSEDRRAYIWSLHHHGDRRDKIPLELFEAHDTITTVTCVAPTKTRQHLSKSEDPVFDLCNPPHVTLLSRAESAGSQTSSRPRTPAANGGVQPMTPITTEGGFDASRFDASKESPAYLARSHHKGGHIIVAADYTGKIKVFRQDCSWAKRRQDDWERSSIFTKRTSRASRTGSLATRASQRSLREARNSTSTQPSSDRILSWRQGIASNNSVPDASARAAKHQTQSRSISPRKSTDRKSLDRRSKTDTKMSESPRTPRSAHPLASDVMVRSPDSIDIDRGSPTHAHSEQHHPLEHKADNPLNLQGNASYLYWDAKQWEARIQTMRHSHAAEEVHRRTEMSPDLASGGAPGADHNHLAVLPPLYQAPSNVSQLSVERASFDGGDNVPRQRSGEMRCQKCHSSSFSARRGKVGMQLICMKCGNVVDEHMGAA